MLSREGVLRFQLAQSGGASLVAELNEVLAERGRSKGWRVEGGVILVRWGRERLDRRNGIIISTLSGCVALVLRAGKPFTGEPSTANAATLSVPLRPLVMLERDGCLE